MSFNLSQYQYYFIGYGLYDLSGNTDFTIDMAYSKDKLLEDLYIKYHQKENKNISLNIYAKKKNIDEIISKLSNCRSIIDKLDLLEKVNNSRFGDLDVFTSDTVAINTLLQMVPYDKLTDEYKFTIINEFGLKTPLWSFRKKEAQGIGFALQNIYTNKDNFTKVSNEYKALLGLFYSLIVPFFKVAFKYRSCINSDSDSYQISFDLMFTHQNDDLLKKVAVLDIGNINNKIISSTLAKSVPLNLLLKGVPGTGKSRFIDELIKKIDAKPNQVLRINIHNGTNNSDLMQGIGVKTKEDNAGIIYSEKQGAVLEHLLNSIVNPTKNYVLVLEEIQENSLNKIIGDLIYLIEIDKRTQISENQINPIDRENKFDFVERLVSEGKANGSIKIPSLVENKKPNNLIVPMNFYVFCTSNYRDDKKVIEDNLLRRFDVIELYPDVEAIDKSSIEVRDFFKNLNSSIETVMESQDTHPDRFTIGHANWVKETNINKPLLKTIIEFKDVKNIPFDIVKKIFEQNNSFCGNYAISLKNNSKKLLEYNNYKDLISDLQKVVYSDLLNNEN